MTTTRRVDEGEDAPPLYLSITEAARRYGVDRATARRAIYTSGVPVLRLGPHTVRVRADHLDAALGGHRP